MSMLAIPRDESGVELAAGTQELAGVAARVEHAIEGALERATGPGCPPRLREALRYAVFPGGARLRPSLAVAVAVACGDARPRVADAGAVAVELVHCASLVHDDLPCFDDAALRRGKPSVHRAFGEATALLVGDALIVHAFEELARADAAPLALALATASGSTRGIVAGQAWESEPAVSLDDYHRAKTASLFGAAAIMGALSAGVEPEPWRRFGESIGKAYQAADDLSDVVLHEAQSGKSNGRDMALARPSVVRAYGVDGARARLAELVDDAFTRIPSCEGEGAIRAWLCRLGARLGDL